MLNIIASWRREREAVRELSRLSDRELADLGIARSDIRSVAESASRDVAPRPVPTVAMPAWTANARQSVAA
ncbi:DUF1127 domain-containing protein [Lichenibacterium minor]|jgi:uncharacterized protein YjiS (DUF1127 family)|uniref:DUF1127 domain-containing protein n=1 Tax=Lichenibacterium minor TaxID=2316528 RepID=A0A4Q2U9D4_9HYPH|nr:DUF1127 domain-containing protein [Lichenibacterium minor]